MSQVRDPLVASVYRAATRILEPAVRAIYERVGAGDLGPLRRERLARNAMFPVDSWWHAASLGEIAALEPVLSLAHERSLTGRFIVTTTSRPGREAARKRWPESCLAPLDLPRTIGRALDARRPQALILVETELWPNWIRLALDRGTRVAVVNGRVSDRGWSRWRRGAPVPAEIMARIRAVAARTEEDAARFALMGVPGEAVRVTGNTKHDRGQVAAGAELPWNGVRSWTAGSVRPGEEDPVLDAFLTVRRRFADLRLILVPHHPEAEAGCLAALEQRGLSAARRSRPEAADREKPVLLVDTRGELESLYAASQVAFVGGTLVPRGGHNVMEPAASGVPVLIGPHHANVAAEVKELARAGGLRIVRDADELARAVTEWLDSDALRAEAARGALNVAERARGASARALDWLVERGVLPAV
jgi:3-deoxy-D-manno-octulosonic-acid transferase